jgi:hypothetical protein
MVPILDRLSYLGGVVDGESHVLLHASAVLGLHLQLVELLDHTLNLILARFLASTFERRSLRELSHLN